MPADESNARVPSALPSVPGSSVSFVGATSGIGEAALRSFTKQAQRPRIYFVVVLALNSTTMRPAMDARSQIGRGGR
ncbi:hypothetical protein HJFPF1_11023 [Paramyrothecium foliicola]|nr:hypothetical protein HJFPF1_11023 [Paramyrothecium foliicola]